MASVRKRKWTNRKGEALEAWQVEYRDATGKRRHKQFQRKKDADAYRRKVEGELDRGVHTPDRDTVTFGEACQAWLDESEQRWRMNAGMRGSTFHAYEVAVRVHITPTLGAIPLNRITTQHMQDLVNAKALTKKIGGLKRVVDVMKLVMKFAKRRKWLAVNPLVDDPLRLPVIRKDRVVVPAMDHLHRILEASRLPGVWRIHAHVRAYTEVIVHLALYTGMRRGEICGLDWKNVDFDNNIIRVSQVLTEWDDLQEGAKSEAGERTIPMPRELREVLLRYGATRHMSGLVVVGDANRPIRPSRITSQLWPRVLRVAGLETKDGSAMYHFHALRHAYVSMLIARHVPLWHIAKLVGHSDTRLIEKTYGHLLDVDETHKIAAENISKMLQDHRPEMVITYKPVAQERSEGVRERVERLWREGLTRREIAERTGETVGMVGYWLNGIADERQAKWQEREDLYHRAAEMRAAGASFVEIGAALGVPATRVRTHLLPRARELEMAPPAKPIASTSRAESKRRMQDAARLSRAGLTNAEIGAELGINADHASAILHRARERGMITRPSQKRESIQDAARLSLEGLTNAEIGARLGIKTESVATLLCRARKFGIAVRPLSNLQS